jgi:uncharacterized Zn-binding protein involved in type VI secretion
MANEPRAAHVGRTVLSNADAEFAAWVGKKQKNGRYPDNKGRDFWKATDASSPAGGNVTAMGWKAPASICADGLPENTYDDPYWQKTTSFTDSTGSYVNPEDTPYYVLPKTITTDPKSSPFAKAGIKPGDYVRLTNPENGKSIFAIYAENGPTKKIGEISIRAAKDLGIPSSPTSGGYQSMTASRYLQVEVFPGSGRRDARGRIQKQTNDEIQKNGRDAEAARMIVGGKVIESGAKTVLIGKDLMPAAYADAASFHEGGCPLAQGSDSVSILGKPATRVGDLCTCGQRVVSGEPTVLFFGAPTSIAPTIEGNTSLWDAVSPPSLDSLFAPKVEPWARTYVDRMLIPAAPRGTDQLRASADALFGP